jgi:hypothetical protein
MIATFHRYAVAVALVVLGLAGCSSPPEFAEGTTSPEDTESLPGQLKK